MSRSAGRTIQSGGDVIFAGSSTLDELIVTHDSNLGDVTVNKTLTVIGRSVLKDLGLANDFTVGGSSVLEDLGVNKVLTVHGNSNLGDVTVNKTLTVIGRSVIENLVLANDFTVGGSSVLEDLEVNKDLTVQGNSVLEDLNVNKDLTVHGNVFVNGTQTIINTVKLSVQDPIIGIGNSVQFAKRDTGLVIHTSLPNSIGQAPVGSNVAIIYSKHTDTVVIGYTPSDIHATDIVIVDGITVDIKGAITVDGDTTLNNTLTVTGNALTTLTGDLIVNQNSNIHGDLTVGGHTVLMSELIVKPGFKMVSSSGVTLLEVF